MIGKKSYLCFALALVAGGAYADTVVFQSNMGTATGFTTTQTLDNTVVFGSNWAAEALDPTTGYTFVPASPGGDTTGLRIETNNTNDATNYQEGVTVYATAQPATSNYDVEVDAFGAFTLPLLGGGTGSTEHYGIVIQASGTRIATLKNTGLNGVNPAFGITNYSGGDSTFGQAADGLSFGTTADHGEGATNIFCYNPATRPANATATLDGQVGSFVFGDPSPATYHGFNTTAIPGGGGAGQAGYNAYLTFPAGRAAADQVVPGYIWIKFKAQVRNGVVTFSVNNQPVVTAPVASTGNKKVGIVVGDPFTSFSNPANQSYFLFDNFKITDVDIPAAASDWQMYQ